jgi:hypothetical protein
VRVSMGTLMLKSETAAPAFSEISKSPTCMHATLQSSPLGLVGLYRPTWVLAHDRAGRLSPWSCGDMSA